MDTVKSQLPVIENLPVQLERDLFLRTLIGELAETLQDVVGLEEARGFISVVGQRVGDLIDQEYRDALQVEKLTQQQVGAFLVDLKRRIRGDFFVIEETDDRVVLGNRACPFAEKVAGRPSLCMMTSNVFGIVSAENLGYAKVSIEQAIANGDPACRITIYFKPTPAAADAPGREYFKGSPK